MKKVDIYVNAIIPRSSGYDGKTGSIVRMVEILKKISQLDNDNEMRMIINSTRHMAEYFESAGIDAEYRIVKTSLKFKNYFDLFFKTVFLNVKSFFVLDFPDKKSDRRIIIYSSSDLFWEVIPAYIYKLKNQKIEWIQLIHHIYPDWKKRQGNKAVNFLGYYLQKSSFFLIKRKADKIIISNYLVRDELIKLGLNEKKLFINSNGIDFDYFQTIQKKEPTCDGVFLARLSHSKGVVELVDIWKRVCDSVPSAKLAMIGGGNEDMKNMLAKKIKERGLEKNIDLLGFLEDDKAHSILKSGKVFVFPSHEEGWGIAIAEAMACGLPVVSWDLPNYKPVFENYTFRIKENDLKLFSGKIIEMLQNESYRKESGEKGKEFIKKYSWKNVAEAEYEIIKS